MQWIGQLEAWIRRQPKNTATVVLDRVMLALALPLCATFVAPTTFSPPPTRTVVSRSNSNGIRASGLPIDLKGKTAFVAGVAE